MRVNELAKQIDMPNKELIAELRGLGIEVKSHSSSIDDKSVRVLLAHLQTSDGARATAETTHAPKKKAAPAKAKKAPTAKTKPPPVEAKADKPPRPDARAIAMQAIARAKARRAAAHQQHDVLKSQEGRPAAPVAPSVAAPDYQRVDLAAKTPLSNVPDAQTATLTPPPGATATPSAPAEAPPPTPRRPGSAIERRAVELRQLPSLPKKKQMPPRRGAPGDKPPDLTVPPSIEVMKLRPTRRPSAGKRGRDDDKKKRPPPRGPQPGGKRIRPGRFLNIDTIEDAVNAEIAGHRRGVRPRSSVLSGLTERTAKRRYLSSAAPVAPRVVKLHGELVVAEFAERIGVSVTDVIAQAITAGEMLTINNYITPDLCEVLAEEFDVKVEIVPEGDEQDVEHLVEEEDTERMTSRPPVVTVMGHVDHGKTTLLDAIRNTNVVDSEFGGITQHIGAYRVETDRGEVVFLDTPGHAAFTAMRARGASVTDIVVLIVAADDALMPQAVEAINHARAAEVPILVAINKIDLPGANVQKVKNDLMQHSLVSEELGGDTIMCEISAKTGDGIDHLLEMISLQSEIMELRGDPETAARGVVIESQVDPQRGIGATVLIQTGTLRVGDPFVCGDVSGRVRLMLDDFGHPVEAALPSYPIEILGLGGCPQVGESLLVVETERVARQIAEIRDTRRRRKMHHAGVRPHITLEGLADFIEQDDAPKTLNLILKGDVQGSVEAVSQAMKQIETEKVNIAVLHGGVGGITESDIQLAVASDAIVIGFNIRADAAAIELASQEGIEIKTYRVIYELLEELRGAMVGMLDKKFREAPQGAVEVRQVFKISRLGNVAGCYVTTGTISRNDKARLVRDSVTLYEGTLNTLRRVKDDVSTVQTGFECGITLTNYQDIKEGDVIETYQLEEVDQTL